MKKLIILCIIIILIIAVGSLLSTQVYSSEKETIKVGYIEYYNIIKDIDSVDKKGYGYDVFNEIDNYMNYTFEFIPYTYEEGIEKLRSGEIDLFAPVTYTEERANEFIYTTEEFAVEKILVTVDDGFSTLYDDEELMNGKKVFTVSYSGYIDLFEDYLERKNIKMEYIYSDKDEVEPILGDYYLTSSLNYIDNLKTTAVVGEINSYVIAGKENTELIKEIDNALQRAKEENPMLLYSLHDKYYQDSKLAQKDFTKEHIAYALEYDGNDFIEVAVNIDQKPISYINEEGYPDGIAVKSIELLAETYGFKIQYLMYNVNTNSSEEIAEIYNISDIILSQTRDLDLKQEKFSVSDSYASIGMMTIMTDATMERNQLTNELVGKIGMLNYDTFDIEQVEEYYNKFELEIFENMDEMIKKYNKDELQAIIVSEAEANQILEETSLRNTQLYSTPIEIPIRLFVNKNFGETYLEVYNIMIDRVGQAAFREIEIEEVEGFTVSMSISRLIREYTPEVILVIITLILIIYYYRNKRKKKLIKQASIDKVTGLDSLLIFYQKFDQLLKKSKENEYIVMTIDIDVFKIIKETYGNEKVSNIIKNIAEELNKQFGKDNLISRIENDVFVLIMKNEQTELEKKVKKLVDVYILGAKKELPKTYNLSLSVGGYLISDLTVPITKMIDYSSISRVEGKKLYKNTFYLFDEAMKRKYETENEIVSKMKKALEEKEFLVVYQPKINLKILKMQSAEALVRWKEKNEKMIYPDQFIPVFEKNGFITNLDYYVFEEVCRVLNENRNLKMPLVAVNISAITLIEDITPLKMIEILSKYNLKPSNIQIEITESAFVKETDIIKQKFEKLKQLGFSVAIDDFGAGISSLNRLNDLKADVIKIDKGFLDNQDLERGNIIIESIIKMANKLNIKVVTEGVETKEQAELLQKLNCNEAQGYYFEKPISEEQFIKIIEEDKQYKI